MDVHMCAMPALACSMPLVLSPPVSFAHLPNHSDLRICHRADRLVCLPHPCLAAQVPSSMPSMIRMRAARCSLGSGVSSLHQSDHVHTCTKHQSAKPTVHRSVRRLSLRLSCQGRGLLPCVHALSTQCKFNTRTDVYASLLTLKRPRTALPGNAAHSTKSELHCSKCNGRCTTTCASNARMLRTNAYMRRLRS